MPSPCLETKLSKVSEWSGEERDTGDTEGLSQFQEDDTL